ncbi:hypothetical protein HDU96_009891 [Phlyctochytrium bullatum]|nr:hypothetical protein HDU96_009891 [Phlyctochytrium bullatum]
MLRKVVHSDWDLIKVSSILALPNVIIALIWTVFDPSKPATMSWTAEETYEFPLSLLNRFDPYLRYVFRVGALLLPQMFVTFTIFIPKAFVVLKGKDRMAKEAQEKEERELLQNISDPARRFSRVAPVIDDKVTLEGSSWGEGGRSHIVSHISIETASITHYDHGKLNNPAQGQAETPAPPDSTGNPNSNHPPPHRNSFDPHSLQVTAQNTLERPSGDKPPLPPIPDGLPGDSGSSFPVVRCVFNGRWRYDIQFGNQAQRDLWVNALKSSSMGLLANVSGGSRRESGGMAGSTSGKFLSLPSSGGILPLRKASAEPD